MLQGGELAGVRVACSYVYRDVTLKRNTFCYKSQFSSAPNDCELHKFWKGRSCDSTLRSESHVKLAGLRMK